MTRSFWKHTQKKITFSLQSKTIFEQKYGASEGERVKKTRNQSYQCKNKPTELLLLESAVFSWLSEKLSQEWMTTYQHTRAYTHKKTAIAALNRCRRWKAIKLKVILAKHERCLDSRHCTRSKLLLVNTKTYTLKIRTVLNFNRSIRTGKFRSAHMICLWSIHKWFQSKHWKEEKNRAFFLSIPLSLPKFFFNSTPPTTENIIIIFSRHTWKSLVSMFYEQAKYASH